MQKIIQNENKIFTTLNISWTKCSVCSLNRMSRLGGEREGGRGIKQSIDIIEGTARYAGLLQAPVEGFGLRPRPIWPSANHFFGLQPRPLVIGVQVIPKGLRGTKKSKRYLKVQQVPQGPRGILRSKRYLKGREVPKGPRGT